MSADHDAPEGAERHGSKVSSPDHFEGLYFDDLAVGQRFVAGPRPVTQEDLRTFNALSGDTHPIHWDEEYCATTRFGRPILHGPFGLAVASGLMHDMRLFGEAIVAMRSTTWELLRPIVVGDELSLELTVTRCRCRPGQATGTVHRWLRLLNQDGDVVQAGMSNAVVKRRPELVDRPGPVAADFGSPEWAQVLRARLDADGGFTSATAAFDGAIGFRAGDHGVHLRVHRGRILDVSRQSDASRRFVLVGSEPEWVDLAFAPRNDFIARATHGRFAVEGDTYEYLRLTKAIHLCWDHIRVMAAEPGGARAGPR